MVNMNLSFAKKTGNYPEQITFAAICPTGYKLPVSPWKAVK
jgi:hypothetical protein